MTDLVTYVREDCGNDNILFPSYDEWDVKQQEFVSAWTSLDTGQPWCNDCMFEVDVEERPIADLKTAAIAAINSQEKVV